MNNDLISRSALKKAIENLIGYSLSYEAILNAIDNAPTVEIPTELCKGCRFLKDCETCEEKLRPQGEWIEVDIKPTPYGGYTCNRKCKRCNYFTKEYRLNFCPNCGADMRKGGADMRGEEK